MESFWCYLPGIIYIYILIGDELGNATYTDRLLVSWALLSTPICTLIGNDCFWSCQTSLVSKCHLDRERLILELSYEVIVQMSVKKTKKKVLLLRFREYPGEIESDSQNCLDLNMHYCATVSTWIFQVQICSGWRDSTLRTLIRSSAGPARNSFEPG